MADDEIHNCFDEFYECCLELMRESSLLLPEGTAGLTGEVGLSNRGQSCFCNAVIQCLLNTPQFASLYIGKNLRNAVNMENPNGTEGAVTGCLSALADFMWNAEAKWVCTSPFLDVFSTEVNEDFDGKEQQDAHEFQTLLLAKLSEDVQRVENPVQFAQNFQTTEIDAAKLQGFADEFWTKQQNFSSSVVNDIFNLTSVTLITCSKCGNVVVNFEEQNHLSIDINFLATPTPEAPEPEAGSPVTLDKCLANHFGASVMEAKCDNCDAQGMRRPSSCYHCLWKLPNVLVIQLKRFGFENGKAFKNCRQLKFPLVDLDLKDYLHPEQQLLGQQGTKYALYGVVVHKGKDPNSGHYVAAVKNLDRRENCWNLFSDKKHSPIDPEKIQSDMAYLLYYTRCGVRKGADREPCTARSTISVGGLEDANQRQLKIVPAERIVFKYNEDQVYRRPVVIRLRISNPTNKPRLYKVKCTNDQIFKVRTPVGLMKAGEDAKIDLKLANTSQIRHGSHIRYSIYTTETEDDETDARLQWNNHQPQDLKRVFVKFEKKTPPKAD